MGNCKFEKVTKRDGSTAEFDPSKIRNAIYKANIEAGQIGCDILESDIDDIVGIVIEKINNVCVSQPDVEEIQDFVVFTLAYKGCYQLMKLYSDYRYKHELIRRSNSTDESILTLVRGKNKELNEENSNKSTMLNSTQRDYMAGEVSKDLTKRILLPEYIVRAHEEGVLHFHDMDYFVQPMFNCCLLDIGSILDDGTVMNGKMIESPHTFRVACTVTTQVIAAVASNQYGGQTVDTCHLGKYLRRSKEKIERNIRTDCGDSINEEIIQKMINHQIKEELSAGVQTIQYQINTLMTTNGQAPFVTLFMYLRDDDEYIEENAMIIEEIIKQRYDGIKNEKGVYITPAFPKLIYVLTESNNLRGGKYDYLTELAVKCTAKRMYPDYISEKMMKKYKDGTVVPPMGCRSMLSPWKDENGNYKYEGRFNCGVVSINLPQIGIVSKDKENPMEFFWEEFDRRLQICFDALMCRHKACCEISTDNSPIHWQHGAISRLPKHSDIKELLYGGYSTISLGYIGLYEVTKLMTGVSHTDPKGTEFAMQVMKHLRETTDKWKAETNIGFALYGTPAESLCYRFAKIDQERFGDIEDVTDKGYYVNSYHVDPREHISAFDKLTFEAQFQPISAGGCISYVEIPNMYKNMDALREMVKFIYDTIIYAEFNTKSDYCMECGFDGEILLDENNEWYCPNCGNRDHAKMNVVRRTCGYLGENYWNSGRTKEIKSRVLHVD